MQANTSKDINTCTPIKRVATIDLIPYANNSRVHSDEQVNQIASSIKEFGFLNPIIIDGDNGIIAGHGRVMAANKLGIKELPCVDASHLSEAQKKAYVIADNKIALNSDWDYELLKIEFNVLDEFGFDLSLTGFGEDELANLFEPIEIDDVVFDGESQYTDKIETPIYDLKGENPDISELANKEKYLKLIDEIEKSDAPTEIKNFLTHAASRHIRFDYEKIAEFYAHADNDVQSLFERSALVIVDYDSAIENGYIELTEKLMALSAKDDRE